MATTALGTTGAQAQASPDLLATNLLAGTVTPAGPGDGVAAAPFAAPALAATSGIDPTTLRTSPASLTMPIYSTPYGSPFGAAPSAAPGALGANVSPLGSLLSLPNYLPAAYTTYGMSPLLSLGGSASTPAPIDYSAFGAWLNGLTAPMATTGTTTSPAATSSGGGASTVGAPGTTITTSGGIPPGVQVLANQLFQQGIVGPIEHILTGGGGLLPGLANAYTNVSTGGLQGLLLGTPSNVVTGPNGGLIMNPSTPGFFGTGGQNPVVSYVQNLFGGGSSSTPATGVGGPGAEAGATGTAGAVGGEAAGTGVFTGAGATASDLAAMGATGTELAGGLSAAPAFVNTLGTLGVYGTFAAVAAGLLAGIMTTIFGDGPDTKQMNQELMTQAAATLGNSIPMVANANDLTGLTNLRQQLLDLKGSPYAEGSDALGIADSALQQVDQLLALANEARGLQTQQPADQARYQQIQQYFSDLHQQANIRTVGYPIASDQTRAQAHVEALKKSLGVDTATAVQAAVAQGDVRAGQATGWVPPEVQAIPSPTGTGTVVDTRAHINPTTGEPTVYQDAKVAVWDPVAQDTVETWVPMLPPAIAPTDLYGGGA